MSVIRTTFIGKNPFFDPDNIKVNFDKQPPQKIVQYRESRYANTFKKMKVGASITVPNHMRESLFESLKRYIRVNKKKGMVKSFGNDPVKGQATIYWLEERND